MYKNILQGIDNIAIWPVVSFVIFFLFFIFLIWYVLSTDKNHIREMSSKPLDENDSTQREGKSGSSLKSHSL